MTNSKRFPADEAIHHTGQRGPMVVLASDHDAETERLQRHLDSRNEQIDGYERQLGIDKAGAEHTIGSEIERLTRERDVSRAAIEQLHAAVKTAQELAATRLMEIEKLQMRLKRHEPVSLYNGHDIDWWKAEAERLRGAMQTIVSDGDYTAPEGMKRIAQAALSGSPEPCEQRGPFAGLQSLSFDVSENPTIALVMRFDNIEHAQAARDQLWQPAGAARDASSGERWPKSIAGEAPWCKCPDGDCAGWDEAINHGCCCRVANGR